MSLFKHENYEVKEISFAEMRLIMFIQAKKSARRAKKRKEAEEKTQLCEAESIIDKISRSAKSEAAEWITANL